MVRRPDQTFLEPEGGHEVVPISAVLGQFETPDDAVPEDSGPEDSDDSTDSDDENRS